MQFDRDYSDNLFTPAQLVLSIISSEADNVAHLYTRI